MKYDEKYLDIKTLIVMGSAYKFRCTLVGLTYSILPFIKVLIYTVEMGIITAIISGLGFILEVNLEIYWDKNLTF